MERRKFTSSPPLPTLDKEVRNTESNRETVFPRKTAAAGYPLPMVILRLDMYKYMYYMGCADCFYHLWIYIDSGDLTTTNEERCQEFVEGGKLKGRMMQLTRFLNFKIKKITNKINLRF